MTNYRLSALRKSFWVGACSAGLLTVSAHLSIKKKKVTGK